MKIVQSMGTVGDCPFTCYSRHWSSPPKRLAN